MCINKKYPLPSKTKFTQCSIKHLQNPLGIRKYDFDCLKINYWNHTRLAQMLELSDTEIKAIVIIVSYV